MKLDWIERETYHGGPVTTRKQKQVVQAAKAKLALLRQRIINTIMRRTFK